MPCYEMKCVQRRCFQWDSVPLRSDIKGTELPSAFKVGLDVIGSTCVAHTSSHSAASVTFFVIELLLLSLTVEALQGKTCQNSLPSGVGRSIAAKISGGRGHPWFLQNYRHILLSDSPNCTVLRAVVLTQYRRVTDGQTNGQTDGIAVASTALAMRSLRRAVKTSECQVGLPATCGSLVFSRIVLKVDRTLGEDCLV